jgi:hypothetical protein
MVGYSDDGMSISASVGYPPSITFTPTESVFQKSDHSTTTKLNKLNESRKMVALYGPFFY